MREQVGSDEERQGAKLDTLQRDLQTARRAADEAAGLFYSFLNIDPFTFGVSCH